jgi:hypothetical protein
MADKSTGKGTNWAGVVGGLIVIVLLGKACGDDQPAAPVATLAPLAHPVHVTGNGINVRTSASAEALPLATLSTTDSVDYLGRYDDQWSNVRLRNGNTGFVSNKYLEGIAYTPPAAPVAPKRTRTHKKAVTRHRAAPAPVALAYYCASGNTVKYHSYPDCRGLNRCDASVVSIALREAEGSMDPCKFCH